jgi:copper chaperone CopZ
MRKLGALFFGIALVVPVVAATGETRAAAQTAAVRTVSIPVKGMACGACATRVKKTLSAIEGVKSVEVSAPKASARVSYEPGKVSPEQLQKAVNDVGFEAGAPQAEK